jgi:hypothetical protein
LSKPVDVEHLADLRSYLEKRLRDLESKVELYKSYIRAVDSVLAKASFTVAADMLGKGEPKVEHEVTVPEKAADTKGAQRIDLTSRDNRMKLGQISVHETSLVIVPAQNVRCPVDSGPFNTFFVKNILAGMKDKDEEQVKLGKMNDKEKINFKITKNNDDTLKEITISNYGDEKRFKRITQTIVWTFEKTPQKQSTE